MSNQNNVNVQSDTNTKSNVETNEDGSVKSLSQQRRSIERQLVDIQNGEALENSRLQSQVNTLAFDMTKYRGAADEHKNLSEQLETRKKKTAEKIKALNQQLQQINEQVAKELNDSDRKIQESILKISNSAAKEGLTKFQGKTPDQFTEEQGKKAFQSDKGEMPKEQQPQQTTKK